MHRFGLVFLTIIMACQLWAQPNIMGSGARSYALGGISVSLADAWSAFNNPAAMPFYGKSSLVLQAENRFGMAELNRAAVGGSWHGKGGDIGLTLNYDGYSLFNQHALGLSFARRLGKGLSAAAQLNMNGVQVSGYGSEYRLTGTVAIFMRPIESLDIGVNFENITRSAWTDNAEFTQYLPALARFGATYTVEKNVKIATEFVQEFERPLMIKGGLEYGFAESFFARAGFTTVNTMFNFGFGYRGKEWALDVAAGVHQYLGLSPRISFQWEF